MLDENAKTHPMLRPYKTFSEKVMTHQHLFGVNLGINTSLSFLVGSVVFQILAFLMSCALIRLKIYVIDFFSRRTCHLQYFVFSLLTDFMFFTCFQDKEIYRWPIKESIKAMLAWEWTVEKARDGEVEAEKKAATRKISQTAQVKEKV